MRVKIERSLPAVALAAVMLFGACKAKVAGPGYDMADQKMVDEMFRDRVVATMGADRTVLDVSFYSVRQNTANAERVVVSCVEEDRVVSYTIDVVEGAITEESEILNKADVAEEPGEFFVDGVAVDASELELPSAEEMLAIFEKGVRLGDVDVSKVASNIGKAVDILREEGISYEGVNSYEIHPVGDGAEHIFLLQTKVGDRGYFAKFRADARGEVEYWK